MSTSHTSPNMGLTVPTPGSEPGPNYATDISNALDTIDAHGHTGADGKQLGSAALNVDNDISWNQNNITNLRAGRFTSQSAVLAGVGDVSCIYFKGGDLWINNSSGTNVQVTSGTGLNTSSSNTVIPFLSVASNHTIAASDTDSFLSVDTTTTRTITLPTAASVTAGRRYVVTDKTGTAYISNITIAKSGTDTINGATSFVVNAPYGGVTLISNGVDAWLAQAEFDTERGRITLGSTPATSGVLCMTNNTSITMRNAANSGNITLLTADATNVVIVGETSQTAGIILKAKSGSTISFLISGTTALSATANVLTVPTTLAIGTTPAAGGDLRLNKNATIAARNAANSADLTILQLDGADSFIFGTSATTTAVQCQTNITIGKSGSTKIEVNATGIGFNSSTPVGKQSVSGSRGANAALASLITAFANFGLIADGTTV